MGYAERAKETARRMKRKLHLDPDVPADRRQYTLLCHALIGRGSQAIDRQTGQLPRLSKDEKRSDYRIKRVLWPLGEPDADLPEPKEDEPDTRARRLIGGDLILDQPDFARLLKYVEDSQWTLYHNDDGVELEDRLDAAEKISEDGTAEDHQPKQRRFKRA